MVAGNLQRRRNIHALGIGHGLMAVHLRQMCGILNFKYVHFFTCQSYLNNMVENRKCRRKNSFRLCRPRGSARTLQSAPVSPEGPRTTRKGAGTAASQANLIPERRRQGTRPWDKSARLSRQMNCGAAGLVGVRPLSEDVRFPPRAAVLYS